MLRPIYHKSWVQLIRVGLSRGSCCAFGDMAPGVETKVEEQNPINSFKMYSNWFHNKTYCWDNERGDREKNMSMSMGERAQIFSFLSLY